MTSPFYLQNFLRLATEHPHFHHAMEDRSKIPSITTTPLQNDQHQHQHQRQQQTQKPSFTPSFDVLETGQEYILEGELPGLHDKEQTVIEFTDARTILIRGRIERDEEGEKMKQKQSFKATVETEGAGEKEDVEGPDKVWVAERRVGEFQRGFTFPGSVDVDAVRATLEHGVLRIVVPKVAKPGAKRIQIQ